VTSDRPRVPSWFPESGAAPRTIDEAMELVPDATLAVVGAAQGFAAIEVRRAVERGLDVLVVGEGLSSDDAANERVFAAEHHRVVMAGGAIVDGIALGAASPVLRGPLGIVAVDVAGAMEAATAAQRAGVGVSHLVAIGDEDLAVSRGAGTLAAIARLASDPSTTGIAVVGAAEPQVARALRHACAETGKPAVICAFDEGARRGSGWEAIPTIDELPRALARLGIESLVHGEREAPPASIRKLGTITGALASATLVHEALTVWLAARLDVASDVPRAGVLPVDAGGHTLVSAASGPERATWVRHWTARADVAAILVDVSSADLDDGGADLLDAIRGASRSRRGHGSLTVALRTDESRAIALEHELRSLGVHIERTVASAARRVRDLALGVPPHEAAASSFAGRPLSAIALAAEDVAAAIERQGAPVVRLAWTPPAGGDERIARLVGLLR
jgi:FdrA protein